MDNELIETCEACGCPIDETESNYGEGICDNCYEIEHEHDGESQCDECYMWTDDNELADFRGMCEACHDKEEEINEAIQSIKHGMETLESYGYYTIEICQEILKEIEEK